MAVVLGDGFKYQGTSPNFERDKFATIAKMKAMPDSALPQTFIATCDEDGAVYVYDKSNTVDAVTGKWRKLEGGGTVDKDIKVTGVGTVGAFTEGTVVSKGTTLTELLEQMLVKTVHPTYVAPTVTISANKTIIEKDVDNSVTLTVKFTKNDAGALSKIGVTGKGSSTSTSTFTLSETVNDTTTFEGYATYAQGAVKKNNLGEDDPEGRIAAGTKKATTKVTAVYPYYYGTSETNVLTAADLTKSTTTKAIEAAAVSGTKKTHLFSHKTSLLYRWFAYDSTYGNLKKIEDDLGQDNLSDMTTTTLKVGNCTYKIYITKDQKKGEQTYNYIF